LVYKLYVVQEKCGTSVNVEDDNCSAHYAYRDTCYIVK
jgi:hypothetical protein